MTSYKVVMPGHMNQYGHLFGGNLLKWIDEIAWMAASVEYENCRFVTIGMDKVEFKKGVSLGEILRFETRKTGVGTTSVTYHIDVFSGQSGGDLIFCNDITFVRVDENGRKTPI